LPSGPHHRSKAKSEGRSLTLSVELPDSRVPVSARVKIDAILTPDRVISRVLKFDPER